MMQSRSSPGFATEVDFTLPKGYLDATGILHRRGTMRLATAADEIQPLRDPRVAQNPAYLAIIVLARVVTKLGDVENIDARVIENLYASDLDFLQRLYERINSVEEVDAPEAGAGEPRNGAVPARGVRAVGEA